MRGRKAPFVLLLTLLGSMHLPATAGETDREVSSHPMIGEMAQAFQLEEVDGGTLSLDGMKDRYVVIHFGASW